jgi:metallo-beta-lactamase family protein
MIQLAFLGAAGTVTGSKLLLQAGDDQLLVDCGLFQGLKELRLRNWAEPPFDPGRLRWVLLTHAHIDHSGWLPRLSRHGFRGQVLCTPPTLELASVMLRDSAHLQEEDARFYNESGHTKHRPALPLYELRDVERLLPRFRVHDYGATVELSPRLRVRFRDAGHLLGSAMIDVWVQDGDRNLHVLFSGDVGRYDAPLVPDPTPPGEPDYLVIESTYGDRDHPAGAPIAALQPVLERMLQRRAILLVPAFAVGRAQQILYLVRRLQRDGQLPEFPIHIDSPMAVDATLIYRKHMQRHGLAPEEMDELDLLLAGPNVHLARTVQDSKRLNHLEGPALLLSSSGMLAGGRVLHHLARLLPERRHLVALVGYQAAGTRGRALQEGARSLRIHGHDVPVHAEIVDLGHLSGHADRGELERWLAAMQRGPRRAFVTHGEPQAAAALAAALRQRRGWDAVVPELGQVVEL